MSQVDSTSIGNIADEAAQEENRYIPGLDFDYKLALGELNQKIVELRRRVEKLEEQSEHKAEPQIIPIQFLESEKLELKQPIVVSLCYYPKDEN